MWSRIYLIPLLQAEEDRDQVRRYLADRAREKELLGKETSPYNSDRYDKRLQIGEALVNLILIDSYGPHLRPFQDISRSERLKKHLHIMLARGI
jgi:hypothetical protein